MHGIVGELGRPPFAHGGFRAVRRSVVLQPQRLQAQQPRRPDLRFEFGKRMRHPLKRGQGLAERLPLRDIGPGLFQGDTGHGENLQSDQGAGEIKTLHHLYEALVLLAEPVRRRHANVFEEDGSAPDRALAVTIEAAPRDARQIHRNEQRGDAMRAGFRGSGAAEHHRGIGLVGGRNRGLFAVDDVFVADPLDLQPQIGGVGTAARFGQRDRQQRLAARQPGEPWADDVRPAVMAQDLAVQRGQEIDVGNTEVGAGDLFMDDAGCE